MLLCGMQLVSKRAPIILKRFTSDVGDGLANILIVTNSCAKVLNISVVFACVIMISFRLED